MIACVYPGNIIHIPDTYVNRKRLYIRSQWRQSMGQQPLAILPFSNRQNFLSLINQSWYLRSIPTAPRLHINSKSEQEPLRAGRSGINAARTGPRHKYGVLVARRRLTGPP